MNISLFYFVKELPFIKIKILKHFRDTYSKKNITVSYIELKKIFKIFTVAYVFEIFVPRGNQQDIQSQQHQKFPDLITRNLLQRSVFKVIKDNKQNNNNDQNKENQYDSSIKDINKTLNKHKRIIPMKNEHNIYKEKGKKIKERYNQNNSLYDKEDFTDIKTHTRPNKGYSYLIKQFNELDF